MLKQVTKDIEMFKIARKVCPVLNKWIVSNEKVLNVLKPPQKPINTRGCTQCNSGFLNKYTEINAKIRVDNKFDKSVAIGKLTTVRAKIMDSPYRAILPNPPPIKTKRNFI